jgi:succinyl-diaminopimelate desuccinylase
VEDQRERLLRWVEADRERLVDFFSRFIQARSPNPPGDTREAARHVQRFLEGEGLPYRVIAPRDEMPNIVASFGCGAPGRHLVLNGHIDVYPVGDGKGWRHDPWGGTVANGRVYGRGACDMKCGTTASVFTYAYMYRLKDVLRGRLTLTCVSDEETFGPWGARYLMEHHPEIHGDTLLNGEPCAHEIRFGEKGVLWLTFTVSTPGAHGAYQHASPSATKIAARLMLELDEAIGSLENRAPDEVVEALEGARATIERSYGEGAFEVLQKTTVNFGTIHGGLKVNMIPGEVKIEADFRLPVGQERARVLEEVNKVVARFPEVNYKEVNFTAPSSCDPDGEMVGILRRNIEQVRGHTAKALIAMGGTDARLWRYEEIPAYVYGPYPQSMGSTDEYVEVEEFIDVVKIHVLSAYDYLSGSTTEQADLK